MKNIKLKNSIFVIVGISAIAWFSIAFITGVDLSNTIDFFKIIPTVVTIDTIILTLFIKIFWKWRIFKKWLVPFPNLNGTWIGKINSNWTNPETEEMISEIPVMLTINQSFFHLSCVMQTLEMKSQSIMADIYVDRQNQIKQLSYIYNSRPKILIHDRSLPHDGAIIFDIIEKPERKLLGRYWTERNTKGELNLFFKSKKIFEEISSLIDTHPLHNKELKNK